MDQRCKGSAQEQSEERSPYWTGERTHSGRIWVEDGYMFGCMGMNECHEVALEAHDD